MSPRLGFPSREDGLALHVRLTAVPSDATVSSDLCLAYLPPLVAWLQRRNPPADSHLCESAASDALLDYLQHPLRYDPTRSDLASYLRMASEGDLRNLLRRERRHAFVELDETDGNYPQQGTDPLQTLESNETTAHLQNRLAQVYQECSPDEVPVLELMLGGERSTATYADLLGMQDLSPADQERAVKRVKDRLKKRLLRGIPHDEPN